MESKSQNLFKNVYHLVDKESGHQVTNDVDFVTVLDKDSKY